MKTEDLATLEGLVDTYSLPRVLEALAEVCNDKASHLRSAWQDENAAKRWDGAAKYLTRAAFVNPVLLVQA